MSNTEFVDQDVERLVSAESPRDPGLAALSDFFEALRSYGMVVPSIDAPEHLAAQAARTVRSGRAPRLGLVPSRTGDRPDRRPSLLPTRAVAALLAFVLLIGVSAVGAAANLAAPGDALYGVDRALESVGIGDGSVDERLVEADSLLAGGNDLGAVTLLGETIHAENLNGNAPAVVAAQRHLEEVFVLTSTDAVIAEQRIEQVRALIAESGDLDGETFANGLRSILDAES